MAINKFAKEKMKEFVAYFVAFMLYVVVFDFFGFDTDTLGGDWGIFAYYLVVNIVTIPTAGFLLALVNRYKRRRCQ